MPPGNTVSFLLADDEVNGMNTVTRRRHMHAFLQYMVPCSDEDIEKRHRESEEAAFKCFQKAGMRTIAAPYFEWFTDKVLWHF